MSMGYEVLFYHSGAFAHVPVFDYVGRKDIFPDVDLENLSVEEIEGLIGDKKGEFDVVFYARKGSGRLTDLVVLNESSKENMLSVGRSEGMVRLYVAHITNVGKPNNFEDGGSSGVNNEHQQDKRYKSLTKRDCGFIESDRDESSEDEEEEDSDDGAGSCSDDELNEIRKMRAEMKKSQKALDEEEAELIRRKLQRSRESGLFGGDNDWQLSGSFNSFEGEDSEDNSEVAYAEPSGVNKKMKQNEIFNKNIAAKDIVFKVGLIFDSKKEFKDAVRDYSIATGRPWRYDRDDKQRIKVVCDKGCPYSLWLSHVPELDGWQIKTINEDHNCIYQFRNKLVTSNYLAELYGARIRRNPNWKLQEMMDEFKNVLNVEVNESMACRVRQRALYMVEQEMHKHYANLRRFGGEILKSNKENTVKIQTTRENEGDPAHFQRMYVSFVGLRRAWKAGCRPVLGLDGCFLKTVTGGQLLSAVGRDPENSILPVAFAVVENECYDSWRWFLDLVVEDLGLGDGRVMHCSFCNGEGHNISGCKEKPDDWVNPKQRKKRVRKDNVQTEQQTEVENIANEHKTGEAELMEEALRESNIVPQSTPSAPLTQTSSPVRQSQRLKEKQNQTLPHSGSKEPQLSKGKKCVFMPTPSLVPLDGFGGTPPASTPLVGSSQQSSTVRKIGLRQSTQAQSKKFKVPRKK